jgi:hypothetical protein
LALANHLNYSAISSIPYLISESASLDLGTYISQVETFNEIKYLYAYDEACSSIVNCDPKDWCRFYKHSHEIKAASHHHICSSCLMAYSHDHMHVGKHE